jgi:hypothetical protein
MALLQYDIKVVGADTVDKAFASIEARLRQHNRTVSQLTGLNPAQAARAGRPGGAAASALRASNDNASRETKRALDMRAREEMRARNQVNAVGVREMRKEEREKLASIKRTEKEKLASVKREHKEQVRSRMQMNAVGLREMRREQREAITSAKERSKFARETLGHGTGRVSGTVGAVGRIGTAMAGVAGAGLAASAVAGATRLDEMTRRLVISGRQGGERARFDPTDLRKQFEKTGIETGVAGEDIATGVQAFVTKTGDLDTAVKNHKVFAQVAQATGAAVEDVASAAADLSDKMDIKSVADMKEALATLMLQGKKGAFELRDMATQFPRIAAAAASFGIKGVAGLTQLGGFLQVARTATGSGEQAAFATEASFRQLTAKSPKIQSGAAFGGRGVEVFKGGDATKGLRDFNEILGDVMQASRGNMVQLQEVFGEEGIRAIRPLITTFRGASEKAGGGETGAKAGREAVMAQLKEAATVKGGFGEVEKDAADAMKSFSVQMAVVEAKFKQAIAEELMPEVMKLGPELAKLVPYVGRLTKLFVDVVQFLMNHPFASLGAVIAVQLAADFAKARLGSVVTGFVEKIFQKIRLPSAGGGSAPPSYNQSGQVVSGGGGGGFMSRPTGASALGAAGTGLAMGLTIGTAILTAGVVNFERGEADMKTSGQALNRLRELAAGPATPESKREAQEILNQQKAKVAEVEKGGMVSTLFGRGVAEGIGVERPEELKTQQSYLEEATKLFGSIADKADQQRRALEEAAKALKDGGEAIGQAAGKLGGTGPNRGNTPSPVKG